MAPTPSVAADHTDTDDTGYDDTFNAEMAARFRRAGKLLEQQDADPFRVRAYEAGAEQLERLSEPASSVYRREGLAGLIALPAIGQSLAHAIADIVDTGRWHWLDRLEGTVDPEKIFATIGGIGPVLANRLHDQLGVESLEELERAANDGRLASIEGFGPKRVRAIVETLDARLRYRSNARQSLTRDQTGPTVDELLDIDHEYRTAARAGTLPMIRPSRFNPGGKAWLPILHTTRGPHHYTALFSNTARAHALGQAHDWVVIYAESPDHGTWTVVTETRGPMAGKRVVRGRTG